MVEQKNLKIEMLRFWFTIVVCLHHFRMYTDSLPYGGGYIAVDFFFMLSGYFLLKHIEKKSSQKNTWKQLIQYVLERYLRLFPAYFLAFIMAFFVRKIWLDESFTGSVGGYIREIFMIEFLTNGSNERVNPADWYCGYLLLGSVLVYILFILCNKTEMYLVISILGYLILLLLYGHINVFPKEENFFSVAILRAISGLCAGAFLYRISEKKGTRIEGRYCTWISIGLFGVTAYMMLWDNAYKYTDYLVIIFIWILIYCAVQKTWKCSKMWMKLDVAFAGSISYSLFLNHFLVVRMFTVKQYMAAWDWKIVSVVYLGTAIAFSIVMFLIEKWLGKVFGLLSRRNG